MRARTLGSLTVLSASLVLWLLPIAAGGQAVTASAGTPPPPASDIALVDFARSNLGPLGTGASGILRALEGTLEIVDHPQGRMLRASSRSTLVLSLPSTLLRDFTLEFDLVPKECCQPEDLAIEGSGTLIPNQGPASANILWSRESFQVIGGGQNIDRPVPDAVAASLPGALTNIRFTFRGDELTVYTNAQLLYTLPNRLFIRGRRLRVFLGGQNDTDRAVYLARVRVASGVGASSTVASGSTQPAGSSAASPTLPAFAGNVFVTPGATGPIVRWTPSATPAAYQIVRWKADDPVCCLNASPTSVTTSPWQDAPPPQPGTYTYQVTAFTSGGPFVAQGQFVHQGSGGRTVVTSSAGNPVPQVSGATTTAPVAGAPNAANAGSVPAGMTVSATMGPSGPVVSWNIVAGASGYVVSRAKSDDASCCNATSGTSPLPNGPWQDQAPPVSGTYVYTVTATTSAGQLQGSAQLSYTAPVTFLPVNPITSGGTATAMPAAPAPPTSSGSSGGPGMPTDPCPSAASDPANPMSAPTAGSNTMTSTSTASPAKVCPNFRVTLTGFDAYVSTLESQLSPDGRGDEVYAATVALLWNRKSQTTTDVKTARTNDYGDTGLAGLWPGRIKAGSLTNEGGITGTSATKGPDQVALQLLAWEGLVTDDDVLVIVPTLWEKDLDPVIYTGWQRYWANAPLSFFQHQGIINVIADPTFKQILNPLTTIGTPVTVPLQDLTGNVRDHPIGTEPQPPAIPVLGRYQDRLIVVTREKLSGLNVGSAMMVPVQYAALGTLLAKEHYTLYVRIERVR